MSSNWKEQREKKQFLKNNFSLPTKRPKYFEVKTFCQILISKISLTRAEKAIMKLKTKQKCLALASILAQSFSTTSTKLNSNAIGKIEKSVSLVMFEKLLTEFS